MNNTIHAGNAFGLGSLISGFQKKTENTVSKLSYKDILASIQSDSASETAAVKSAADMTMAEYTRYIYDKISSLTVHPTQFNRSASVFISEDGFVAMKNDPDYEKWVLGKLQEDFSVCNPIAAMHQLFVVYRFGAEKSDYRGDSWYDGFQNGQGEKIYQEKSQGSFWNERSQKKQQAEMEALLFAKRKRMKEISDEIAYNRHMNLKTAAMGEKI